MSEYRLEIKKKQMKEYKDNKISDNHIHVVISSCCHTLIISYDMCSKNHTSNN